MPDDRACRLGVLAFGDSITNGGGELQWGVALQSWALWTARGLGLSYSPHADDGALVSDVVNVQIPRFERTVVDASARYELGCLYIGTNDVRRPGFDLGAFDRNFDTAMTFLHSRCDRLLTGTLPLDMGRPRTPGLIAEVNDTILRVAARHQALVVDLSRFGGRTVLMADHVHPTAFGQIAIAESALDLLEQHGFEIRVRPSALINYRTSGYGRLRRDLTYAYRHAKRSLARRLSLRVRRT
jgi:lysophospholipase L1-like esterase